MENIAQNKLKFFAQHFGQKVLKNDKYQELSFVSGFFLFHNATYSENYHLELRDINTITDDEKIELFNFKYPEHQKENKFPFKIKAINDFTILVLKNKGSLTYLSMSDIDFLRSKGFLVPFMNLTTDQILEFGWAKIKENEQTKGE